ncbi:hypothetical protein LPJ53_003258 [Coemansia erecta]|uniref:Uncharacterized protein n=1 Tax=Coemansia erecta TaxID=147472 RepID=A0A9W8CSM5_9FUNG|nr:hypothetical protein LPJ53_003258 [Coemansia erecta]
MTVYIVAPSGLQESDRWFYGGFINFSLKWDGDTACSEYVVPYAGFNGNYRRLKIFTPNDSSGLPALANSSQGILSDPSQLVISGNATALLLYSIEVPTRILSATMVSSTGKVVGYLGYGYVEYDIRNLPLGETPVSGAIIANSVFSDKEETTEVDVPPGRYHARLMALYPFGNPKNPEDYQTWDSPEFTIA